MKKTFTILTVAAMLFAASAKAQKEFVYDFTSVCGESYEAYSQSVDAEAIEAEIGCELFAAAVYAVMGDGTEDPNYKLGTTDGWRNADGNWQAWGAEARICVKADFAPQPNEEGQVGPHISYIGGMSGQTGTPATYTAKYKITNPDDASKYCFVIINVNYVQPLPHKLSDLQIVKTIDIKAQQYPRSNTTGESIKTVVGDLASLIDADAELFQTKWNKLFLYIGHLGEDDIKSESVSAFTGQWLNALFDENTGEEIAECIEGSDKVNSKFYASFTAYDGDTLTVNIGQYANRLKAGNSNYAIFYFIGENNKAVAIKVQLDIVKKEIEDLPWSQKTRVGGETITLKRDILLGYTPTRVTMKIDSIASLFKEGTVAADLQFVALTSDGEPTTVYTTGEAQSGTASGGFWMTMESNPISWSTSTKSYFVNNYLTRLDIGHMPSIFEGGEKTTGSLFYVLDNEYYELEMDVQIGESIDPGQQVFTVEDCEIVSTQSFTYQIVPHPTDYQNYGTGSDNAIDYHLMEAPIDLDLDYIERMLGTRSPVFYGESIDETGAAKFTNVYSCDPMPGFWMAPAPNIANKSTVARWAAGDTYGICYAEGVFQFFQYPGDHVAGDKYIDNFYLVNTEAGKKMKYIINVEYVEAITKLDIVETLNVTGAPRDAADPNYGAVADIDLSTALEAMGATQEDFENGLVEICAKNQSGQWVAGENYDVQEGFFFDETGKTVNDGTEVVRAGLNEEGQLVTYIIADENLDKTYFAQVLLRYNNKMVIINITITAEISDAIEFVELGTKNGKTYDLSGRQTNATTRGIYIKDGKKILVK